MSRGGALSYCGGCSPRRRQPWGKKHGSAAAREVCGRISPGSCIPGGREMPREGGLQVTNARHCLEKGERKSNMVERFSSLCNLAFPAFVPSCWWEKVAGQRDCFGVGPGGISPTCPGDGDKIEIHAFPPVVWVLGLMGLRHRSPPKAELDYHPPLLGLGRRVANLERGTKEMGKVWEHLL